MRVDLETSPSIAEVPGVILPKIDPRVEVRPDMRLFFRSLGLATPEAFLAIPGEIVSGHPDRHVMRVVLGNGRVAFLKREHRIRWKERFHNLRAGFGWSSKSEREGRVLQYLEQRGFPCPNWLAFGEDGRGRAFLLVEECTGDDLRRSEPDRDLAIRLGRLCAELHETGIEHPDLYAKHVLVDPLTGAITLLDWQRATIGNDVPWINRIRALATLRATWLTDSKTIGTFLWAYLRVARSCRQKDVPLFSELARRIEAEAKRLECRRGIREQRQPPLPGSAQRLVWLDGEALCAIPEVAADLDLSEVRAALYDPSRHATSLTLSGNREAQLEVGKHRNPLGRWLSGLRGRAWRSPELRLARLLFHLERHHIPAPKLFAYGQRLRTWTAEAFLLRKAIPVGTKPLASVIRSADASQRREFWNRLEDLLRRLHDAGCEARSLEPFAVRNGVESQVIFVARPELLIFRRRLSARRRSIDLGLCLRSMKNYCGSKKRTRFFRALTGWR